MSGPPVVLLHAFPVDARLFDPIRAALASHQLSTPDFPGFGVRAAEPLPEPPSLAALADDVVAGLDAEGIDRAVIGGVSMGGYVALAVLREYPGRVAGLVLVDTRAGADDDEATARRFSVADRADRGDVAAGTDAVAPLVAPNASDDVRSFLASIVTDQPPASIAWAQRAMAARPDSTALLAAAGVPVLVVVGERDAVTPPSVAAAMTDGAGDAELVVLPGAGHLTPAEDPAGFAGAVGGWLERRFPAAASAV